MSEQVYFTYRDNLFNQYVDKRVRVVIRNRCKKQKTFIGTFKAYDYHVNLLLADVYRVILNSKEEQREDVKGLLLIRGVNVRSITVMESEPRLRRWPTNPGKKALKKAAKAGSEKSPARSQSDISSPVSTPTTPSKPVKLRRTWLTTPSPGGSVPRPPPQSPVTPGDSSAVTPQPSKKETSKDSGEEHLRQEAGKPAVEAQIEVKQEIKQEEEESHLPTFEEFLLSKTEYKEIEDQLVKMEPKGSPKSDMSTSS